jgi:hypothetical protein
VKEVEISPSFCISKNLGVRVTAAVFGVLCLFHTSEVSRNIGRGGNISKIVISHEIMT